MMVTHWGLASLREPGIPTISTEAPAMPGRKWRTSIEGRRPCGRRWKIERLLAWLGNFRRLVVRYERRALNELGFVQLGSILILRRQG
jgi:transposase